MGGSSRAIGLSVMGVAVLGFVGLIAWGVVAQRAGASQGNPDGSLTQAPDFTLPLFGGGEFRLADHRGEAVVINFWASWCPPCRAEAGTLTRAYQTYQGRGVAFVGVNIQDSTEGALGYLQEFDVAYPNGSDANLGLTEAYRVVGLPMTFFVGRDGTLRKRWAGAISEQQLAAQIEELLGGASPSGPSEGGGQGGFFRLDGG